MRWIPCSKALPTIPPDQTTSDGGFLFVVEGKVYAGRCHVNGCFYSSGNPMAAYTSKALELYGRGSLPDHEATHWMPFPEFPLKEATDDDLHE